MFESFEYISISLWQNYTLSLDLVFFLPEVHSHFTMTKKVKVKFSIKIQMMIKYTNRYSGLWEMRKSMIEFPMTFLNSQIWRKVLTIKVRSSRSLTNPHWEELQWVLISISPVVIWSGLLSFCEFSQKPFNQNWVQHYFDVWHKKDLADVRLEIGLQLNTCNRLKITL